MHSLRIVSLGVENVAAINRKVSENAQHQAQNAAVQTHQFEVDRLTADIQRIDGEKADQLAWANFPLEGLSFDDSRVLLNNVPFSQASQARQLQAAVAIGLAPNPAVMGDSRSRC